MLLRSMIAKLSCIASRLVTVKGQPPGKPAQIDAQILHGSVENSFRVLLDMPSTFMRTLAAAASGHKVVYVVVITECTDSAA
jgi:hypothetical protein